MYTLSTVSTGQYEHSQFGSHVQYDPRPLNNTLCSIAGGLKLAREKLNKDTDILKTDSKTYANMQKQTHKQCCKHCGKTHTFREHAVLYID